MAIAHITDSFQLHRMGSQRLPILVEHDAANLTVGGLGLGLHPKIEVADVHVQQVGDTQPGNSVRIDGGQGLR